MSKSAKKTTSTKKATAVAKNTPQQKPRAKGTAPVEGVVYAPVIADPVEPTAAPSASETPKARKHAEKTDGKMSGLDAAAKVLEEAGTPLGAGEMIERMLNQGLWKTEGKTPAATIYAAITREIKAKGVEARFKKTERGRFAVA